MTCVGKVKIMTPLPYLLTLFIVLNIRFEIGVACKRSQDGTIVGRRLPQAL